MPTTEMSDMDKHCYRVGLVTPSFPPRIGGVEAHVGQLARGLAKLGCDVCVLTQVRHDDPSGGTTSIEDGIEVRRYRDVTRSDHFEVAPSMARDLRRTGSEFDVIHAHSFHGAPALVAALLTSGPYIFTPHYHGVGHTALAKAVHVAYDPVATVIFRRAASVICVSDAEARLLASDYPRVRSRTVVIPNGVDRESIDAAAPFECEHPVVLVAGRLESYKQVDRVIEAMDGVPGSLRLVVVGDGPMRADLEHLAQERGTKNRVRFVGRVETDLLRRWQRTAAVTVCLSRHEAYGLVLAEAVAAGSAVVASDIAAHREVAAAVGGRVRLVPPDLSVPELAAAIEEVRIGLPEPLPASKIPGWTEVAERTLALYRGTLPNGARR
jgi:glycosyltransferase involved in cell wall biosynthesis